VANALSVVDATEVTNEISVEAAEIAAVAVVV
jgi:hypothetical protein